MRFTRIISAAALALAMLFQAHAVYAEEDSRDVEAEKTAFLADLNDDGYAEVGKYKVEKIRDNIYHMDEATKALPGGAADADGNMNNPSSIYFVVEEEDAIIVDLGNPASGDAEIDAQVIVEAMTDGKKTTILYTHSHGDHTGLGSSDRIFQNVNITGLFCGAPDAETIRQANPRFASGLTELEDGESFSVAGKKYTVHIVASHTDGSLMIENSDYNVLFTGDTFGSGFVWSLFNTNNGNPLAALDDGVAKARTILNGMESPKILAGHRWQQFWENNPQRPNEMSIQYFNDMAQVLNGLTNGTTLQEPYAAAAWAPDAVELSSSGCKAKIDTRPEFIEAYLKSLNEMEEAYVYSASAKLSIESVNATAPAAFVIIPDGMISDEEAQALLDDSGYTEIIDRSASYALVLRPTNGETFEEADVERFRKVVSAKVGVSANFKLIGIGSGASFINKYLTGYMNFVSGLALIGGETGETPKASVPAYIAGADASAYIMANHAEEAEEGCYVNPDSRFEIVVTADAPASAADGLKDAWDKVLKLYGRIGNYTEESKVVATWYSRPLLTGDDAYDQARKYQYYDSLEAVEGYTREVVTEDLNGSGTLSLWYEYVPDCVKDAAEGTVPVIFLMHGNTNDPRTQVDTAAWANIAVRDGVILVAPEWQGHVYQGYAYEAMSARRSEEGEETYVISVLEKVLEKYPQADATRVYMSGLSAGSRQTTTYGTENPKYFAAGGGHSGPTAGNMQTVEKYKDTYDFPVIYFTGDCDEYQGSTFDVDNLSTTAIQCLNAFRVLNNMPALTEDDYTAENAKIYGVPWDEVYTIEPTAENIPTIIGGVMANDKGVEISFNRIIGWGHWNYCPDTEYMWNFMKRYARDPETGESILLEEGPYNGWKTEDGKDYWYEDGVKQGTMDDDKNVKDADGNPRGREIYDPASDAWYWLDAEFDGAKAVDKAVWMPYVIQGEEEGSTNGKWVRYDADGRMIKGFKRIGDHYYYFDEETGAGADCEFLISGNPYSGVLYWYEKGERQGTVNDPQGVLGDGIVRGREIFDPLSYAWYWLDANDKGAPAMNKQVWIPYVFQDEEPGSTDGKWVRYDAGGGMIKGWYRNEDGIYYYDPITGALAKGEVEIDGRKYSFDPVTGIAQGNLDVEVDLDTIPTANVTGGRITGYIDANGVKTFLGIPFADTTAGENRFADPKDVVPWSGEKNCAKFGSIGLEVLQDPFMCWSKEYVDWGLTFDNGRMDEDLLNLNVWTKAEKGDKKPVIVYIHGGGNTSGSGQNEVYSGANIVEKDVVYVTVNYRYGLQGFLCFKDEEGNEITGNFAVKDLVKSLEWVRDNIAEFGGDPDNVTIAGQSAGSGMVQNLIICPQAEGLFHRAVAMSANRYSLTNAPTATKEEMQAQAAQALGQYTVADLRAMSTEEINALRDVYTPSAFVLDEEWVPDTQRGAYESGSYNKVDLMVGCVEGDTMLFGGFLTLPDEFTEWSEEAYVKAVQNKVGDKADAFLAAYPAEDDIAQLVNQIALDNSNAGYSFHLQAKAATDGEAKNYQWFFNRVVPDKDPVVKAMWGAFHTGDVGYWLNNFSNTTERPWEDVDFEIGDLMSSYLTNFAATGDPNGDGLPVWEEEGEFRIGYMVLGEESGYEALEDAKRDFWADFYGIR